MSNKEGKWAITISRFFNEVITNCKSSSVLKQASIISF